MTGSFVAVSGTTRSKPPPPRPLHSHLECIPGARDRVSIGYSMAGPGVPRNGASTVGDGDSPPQMGPLCHTHGALATMAA
jgi:hypothetical protein